MSLSEWKFSPSYIYKGGTGFRKIQQDSLRYVTPDTNEGLSIQKLTNCEIRYDMSSLQYCTESVCFYIQNKTNVLDRFHL